MGEFTCPGCGASCSMEPSEVARHALMCEALRDLDAAWPLGRLAAQFARPGREKKPRRMADTGLHAGNPARTITDKGGTGRP